MTRDPVKYAVIAIGVLVGATGLVTVFLPRPAPDLAYHVVAVQLGDPAQVLVTFEVDKAPLATADCQVTATGRNREIVDRLEHVVVGPTPGTRTSRHTVAVPTQQVATSAAVASCVITKTR